MLELDVTMTATRRPDLVAATLQSFSKNLFSKISVRRFFLNIDPLWGNADDDLAVERITRNYFADVVINRPLTPSLGAAVKWLWSKPETDWFFHMEDDWMLLRPVRAHRLLPALRRPEFSQISLCKLGWDTRLKRPARYTTSPGFRRTSFARDVSVLLDPALDPEKQVRVNSALSDYIATRRFRYFGGVFTPRMIRDTGHEWRQRRGIDKKVVAGASIWSAAD